MITVIFIMLLAFLTAILACLCSIREILLRIEIEAEMARLYIQVTSKKLSELNKNVGGKTNES